MKSVSWEKERKNGRERDQYLILSTEEFFGGRKCDTIVVDRQMDLIIEYSQTLQVDLFGVQSEFYGWWKKTTIPIYGQFWMFG